jgi:hypothetical protein
MVVHGEKTVAGLRVAAAEPIPPPRPPAGEHIGVPEQARKETVSYQQQARGSGWRLEREEWRKFGTEAREGGSLKGQAL